MSRLIRVGVVGLGNMGRHHVRHLSELDGVVLAAVCDANAEAVASFQATYHCAGYTDFASFLSEQHLDLVCVITPTPYHFELVKQALFANCHVFVEKPITSTVEQADLLIDLAQAHQRLLSVGHIERFNPSVCAVYHLISGGTLGTVVGIETFRASPMPTQIRDDDVIMDLAVHDIDLCNFFTSQPPSLVGSVKRSEQLTDRADIAQILLSYPGAYASVHVSWISPIKRRGFRLTFTKGYLEADTILHTARYCLSDTPDVWHTIDISPQDALRAELLDVVTAIRDSRAPLVTGRDARETLRIIENLNLHSRSSLSHQI